MNAAVLSPSWVDPSLYPFESNYVRLKSGNMHFIDEGKGPLLLFVHGTPTWSFLYRDFIKDLSKQYRCIAIDHLGFGLSEKPASFSGTPQGHSENLSEFIHKLDLKDITLVVHDFGGPIGLSSAIQDHEKVRQVVLFNTWLWETKNNPDAKMIDKIVNGGIGRFLYVHLNFSPRVLLKKGFANKKNLSKKVHQHYTKPFPNKESRGSLLKLAKSLVGSSDWYQEQWMHLDKLVQKPWLILWGTKDEFITTEFLKKWLDRLPHAELQEFDCGHMVQEEKTEASILAMRVFMEKSLPAGRQVFRIQNTEF